MKRPQTVRQSLPALVRVLMRFWPRIRRERPLLAGSAVALLAATVFQLLEPWPLKFVFDRIIPVPGAEPRGAGALERLDSTTLLALAAVAVVLVALLRAITEYLNRVGFALIGNRVLAHVRSSLYAHLQGLSLSFHHKARSGDLVIRLISDVNLLRDVVVTALLPVLANTLILAGMVAVMFWLEWRLALLSLAVIPLFALTTVRLSRRIHEVARRQREREGAMAAAAAESIGAVKVVQALSLEERFASDFSGRSKKDLRESVRGARLAARLERTVDVLTAIGTAAVLWYGARLVLLGQLSPGELLVFLFYLKRALRPARDFAKYSGRLAKAAAAGERVCDLLDLAPEVRDADDAVTAPPLAGEIRFEQVSFAYEPGSNVLDQCDFAIRPGQFVALVGPSGIGKSTVLSLLLRLYDPVRGRITIDGRDVRQYTVASLRAQISVVLQDNLLFAASVWDNVAYGAWGATGDEIETAMRLANADSFVRLLPAGYDTVLGERGVTLSHGQRQRIAIARAAVRRAPILVLDEPSAGLDEENEHAVMQALRRLAQGRTTLLVTHDLRHAAQADQVLYLEQGHIVEAGCHADLLQTGGRYAALYRQQTGLIDHPQPGASAHAAVG
jgi:ATP-binding cassette, subfamily B, bacterial